MDKEKEKEDSPEDEEMDEEYAEEADEDLSGDLDDPRLNALKGLIQHFGMMQATTVNSSKLKAILEGLRAIGDDDRQYLALQELNDCLSMGTEDTLGAFNPDDFLPPLIQLLNMDYNPEVMLMACRSIANMAEALPNSTANIVNSGAIPLVCAKLLSIEYIDLAEQAITTLEKISQHQPAPILKAGGLVAILSFLDFFPMGVQRAAVSTASNICRHVPSDQFHQVVDAIPILTNLLRYHDHKIVEKACLAFFRLVESFSKNPNHLQSLGTPGMLGNLVYLISPANTSPVNLATFSMIIKLLAIQSRNCPTIAIELLENTSILTIMKDVLLGSTSPAVSNEKNENPLGSPLPTARPSEQLSDLLSLCAELLPPLPKRDLTGADIPPSSPQIPASPSSSSKLFSRSKKEKEGKKKTREGDLSPSKSPPPEKHSSSREQERDETFLDPRTQFLQENKAITAKFSSLLLPILLDVYSTTVSPSVRQHCLNAVIKIIYFSSPDILETSLRDLTISGFIAGILTAKDLNAVAGGLQLCEDLMGKLPHIFRIYFRREGVVHELNRLISKSETLQRPSSPEPTSPQPSSPPPASPSRKISEIMRRFRDKPPQGGDSGEASPSPSEGHKSPKPSQEDLLAKIVSHAQKLSAQYFSTLEGATPEEQKVTLTMGKLKELGEILGNPETKSPALFYAFHELSVLLADPGENISAFELANSEILPGLLKALTSTAPGFQVPRSERLRFFVRIFLGGPAVAVEKDLPQLRVQGSVQALSCLVKRLHEAFSKIEQFPILVHEVVGGSGSSKGVLSGLRVLTQPFKLKLQKMEEETEPLLKDYSENVVMIEPLATVHAIEKFLLPKIAEPALLSKLQSRSSPADRSDDDVEAPGKGKASSRGRNDSEVFDINVTDAEAERLLQSSGSPAPDSPSSSTSSLSSPPSSTLRLRFYIGDAPLPQTMSIFQAIEKFIRNPTRNQAGEPGSTPLATGKSMWSTVYTIKYRISTSQDSLGEKSDQALRENESFFGTGHLEAILQGEPRLSAPHDPSLKDLLLLMRILCGINSLWGGLFLAEEGLLSLGSQGLSSMEFVNSKLNAKLVRQLQDPLSLSSGSFPDWCRELVTSCPFFFLFETRYMYLYSTSFGIARGLMRLQERSQEHQADSSNESFKIGRIQRQKVRISRALLFESALKVMELYASSKAMLEIEYQDEVGTGLGPTLEFFTNTSREFRKKRLGLWRDPDSSQTKDEFVHAPRGLFPRPISTKPKDLESEKNKKRLSFFRILGKFVAKGLLDFRTLDLPFSTAFYKWMLGQEDDLTISDLKDLDPALASSVFDLQKVANEKRAVVDNPSLSAEEKAKRLSEIKLKGVDIAQLSMDFTLPGYPEIELKKNGSDCPVTIENIDEYVKLIVQYTLRDSVAEQFQVFRQGFCSVFPITDLQIFSPTELDLLINGTEEIWSPETLSECVKADHGYTHESSAIKRLITVLSNFNPSEQRDFLKFVTGSPKLPVGGLKSLNPKLTVVRKSPENGNRADDYLPSAMTCANYLKLPDYSSQEILLQKLKFAMTEGQNSFHLS